MTRYCIHSGRERGREATSKRLDTESITRRLKEVRGAASKKLDTASFTRRLFRGSAASKGLDAKSITRRLKSSAGQQPK